ncbi:PepSY-associated TM helix domain-containing protein [Noviherbaspirillum soli]|uniref:PepSY-associated TM helix domain-containing protein n=1 Tax=Noviherbaspirillum soli TaxID=1064518 RepID=UPI00188CD37E|nr:PepSY-associated TM helix domain-containing protein [Noviherbaspirillum soli]
MHISADRSVSEQAVTHLLNKPLLRPLKRQRSRRAIFLTWLRKIHLYVGLWGAVLGLLFGVTGILLNHRAILKIPVEKTVQRTAQLALREKTLNSPEEMAAWLKTELRFSSAQAVQVKRQPAQEVIWADRPLMQPERWTVALHSPHRAVTAEYFVGNRVIKLEHLDATPVGTLTRLHMSVGVSAFWVLLADTIAGSLILLSLTGLLLWTQLHTIRTIAVSTTMGALTAAVWLTWAI